MFEIILFIGIGLIGLLVLSVGAVWGLMKVSPEKGTKLLQPIGNVLMKNKRVRDYTQDQAAEQLAKNPEQLTEMANEMMGKEQAKQVEKLFEGRSERENEEMLKTLMEKAQKGQPITQQDIARKGPRTPEEARAKAQKKQKARAKAKAARKQRKKSR